MHLCKGKLDWSAFLVDLPRSHSTSCFTNSHTVSPCSPVCGCPRTSRIYCSSSPSHRLLKFIWSFDIADEEKWVSSSCRVGHRRSSRFRWTKCSLRIRKQSKEIKIQRTNSVVDWEYQPETSHHRKHRHDRLLTWEFQSAPSPTEDLRWLWWNQTRISVPRKNCLDKRRSSHLTRRETLLSSKGNSRRRICFTCSTRISSVEYWCKSIDLQRSMNTLKGFSMTHCWREIPRCGTDIDGELIKPFQLLMWDTWSLRSSAETIEEGQTFFIWLPPSDREEKQKTSLSLFWLFKWWIDSSDLTLFTLTFTLSHPTLFVGTQTFLTARSLIVWNFYQAHGKNVSLHQPSSSVMWRERDREFRENFARRILSWIKGRDNPYLREISFIRFRTDWNRRKNRHVQDHFLLIE